MNTQKLIITEEQGNAVLELTLACFKYECSLRKPLRDFVSHNYTLDDFREKGVNPFDFDDWLKCGKKL